MNSQALNLEDIEEIAKGLEMIESAKAESNSKIHTKIDQNLQRFLERAEDQRQEEELKLTSLTSLF